MTRPQSKAATRLAIDKPHEVIVRQEFNVEVMMQVVFKCVGRCLGITSSRGWVEGVDALAVFFSGMDVAAVLGRQP
jgi:hypothetical protein